MGVVSMPSAVTGLVAISIMAEMTFMPGRQGSSNFSQTEGASGLAWGLVSMLACLVAISSSFYRLMILRSGLHGFRASLNTLKGWANPFQFLRPEGCCAPNQSRPRENSFDLMPQF